MAAVLFLVFTIGVSANGQALYKLTFKGTYSTLDASGNAIEQRLDNKALISQWAGRVGISDFTGLQLVFHRHADSNGGDAIEVVRKDGSLVVTAFPLTFPEPAVETSTKGFLERRFAYVYNLNHAEFSRGTVIMNEVTSINKKGETNRFAVSGQMQWYEVPEGTNKLRICSGTFKAGKALK